jgi:ribonucleoside-diphosphate reductase alpha chain
MRHGKPAFCKEAFDIDQRWIIRAAAVRQRWLDQSQSLNLFRKATTRGRELSEWYFMAWELGLKSTYYLRNRIVQVEDVINTDHEPVQMCSIENPDCESCQ